jgi:hypothetical protein
LFQEKLIKDFKNSPFFPYSTILPTRGQLFDERDNKIVLTNQKLYSTIFKISQVVADPFIALALFSPPLASSTKMGSILALEPHCLTKIFT